MIFLPLPPKCWRHGMPFHGQFYEVLGNEARALCVQVSMSTHSCSEVETVYEESERKGTSEDGSRLVGWTKSSGSKDS